MGAEWTEEKTSFRVFAPDAGAVTLRLYQDDVTAAFYAEYLLSYEGEGFYHLTVEGNLHNVYYTFCVDDRETIDPYAKSCGANGKRGLVFDSSQTNPEGWEEDKFTLQTPIVWEAHVRDFSSDSVLNLPDAGKFTAFRGGITLLNGAPVGIDYLKALGITYVQLLPVCDYASVDELTGGYNWGYDPAHYFCLEGSYSSNPRDGLARVREFKTLVKNLHKAGIGLILDVVYNHVYEVEKNALEICAPNYYFRKNERGELCNGSGCGNETASEKKMFRRLMIDSVCFLAKEYHVDGFRFDLMGLHDVDTMNELRSALDNLFEDGRGRNILTYGEPWYCFSPYGVYGADKANVNLLNERVGMFNDTFRDGVRGSQHYGFSQGAAQGDSDKLGMALSGILGANQAGFWQAKSPYQQVLYLACHDDYTLADHLAKTTAEEERELSHKIAAFLLFSGIGLVFMQAGEEFAHGKGGNGNSYRAGDGVNGLKWAESEKKKPLAQYYQGLIALRKYNPAFCDFERAKREAILLPSPQGTAVYQIGNILYAYNATVSEVKLFTPYKGLGQVCDNERAGVSAFARRGGKFTLPSRSVFAAIVEE